MTSIATSRTNDLVRHGHGLAADSTSGFARALLVASLLLFGAAVVALRTSNSLGEQMPTTGSGADGSDERPSLPTSAPIAG